MIFQQGLVIRGSAVCTFRPICRIKTHQIRHKSGFVRSQPFGTEVREVVEPKRSLRSVFCLASAVRRDVGLGSKCG
jgi:hypothetical protein